MEWKSRYSQEWQRKFALFPTDVGSDKIVWLKHYYVRYVPAPERMVKSGECYICDHATGGWETTTKIEATHD